MLSAGKSRNVAPEPVKDTRGRANDDSQSAANANYGAAGAKRERQEMNGRERRRKIASLDSVCPDTEAAGQTSHAIHDEQRLQAYRLEDSHAPQKKARES